MGEGGTQAAGSERSGDGRVRRGLAIAMVVVASVLIVPAILAIWVNRQVVNTDAWTETSTELLENPLIRDQFAVYLVNQLYDNVDVEGEIEEALPPRLKPLAGTAAGGLQDLAVRVTKRTLERPRAQQRWADANRIAHLQLLNLLEGGGTTVSTEGGAVVLDLRSLLAQLQERFGVGGRVAGVLPASAARITILRSNQLEAAQTGLKVLKGLPYVLIGLSFLLFGAALLVAPSWRRKALRAYGLGFVIAGLAALVARSYAGDALVDSLATTASVEPAVAAAWTIATPLLVEVANATIIYGVVMLAGALLAGPTRPAVAIRRAAAPYVRRHAIVWGAFALVVALLLWWGPTPATRQPSTALLLVVLLALGTEALRRLIAREHPDAPRGDTLQRVREGVGRSATWVRQGGTAGRTAIAGTVSRASAVQWRGDSGGAPPADVRIEALERLARLRDAGVLDADEFREQKRRILEGDEQPVTPDGTTEREDPAPAGP